MFGIMNKSIPVVSRKTVKIVAAGLCMGFAAVGFTGVSAHAALITFDDAVGAFAGVDGSFLDSGGSRFTNLEPRSVTGFQLVVSDAGAPNNSGPALFSANDADMRMTAVSGLAFDLASFDFARRPSDLFDTRSAELINVIGTLAAGGTVNFQTAGPLDNFVTAVLPGSFTGLSSVLFAPVINANNGVNNYEFQLDNISVSATQVPEPATLAVFGLGLAGLGFVPRRRKA